MKKYENFIKTNTGRYMFIGWYPMLNEDYCIKTKTRKVNNKTWVYKTYRYKNGEIEDYKYGSYIEE